MVLLRGAKKAEALEGVTLPRTVSESWEAGNGGLSRRGDWVEVGARAVPAICVLTLGLQGERRCRVLVDDEEGVRGYCGPNEGEEGGVTRALREEEEDAPPSGGGVWKLDDDDEANEDCDDVGVDGQSIFVLSSTSATVARVRSLVWKD